MPFFFGGRNSETPEERVLSRPPVHRTGRTRAYAIATRNAGRVGGRNGRACARSALSVEDHLLISSLPGWEQDRGTDRGSRRRTPCILKISRCLRDKQVERKVR